MGTGGNQGHALVICCCFFFATAAADNGCTGLSADLPPLQCLAWQELYDSLEGSRWANCSSTRSDPCSCTNDWPQPFITCGSSGIVRMYRPGGVIDGETPSAVGTIPDSFGQLTALTYLVFDRNVWGTIPASFGQLQDLTQLFFESQNLAGTIPSDLPFAQMTRCSFGDNGRSFACPLPPGAVARCGVSASACGSGSPCTGTSTTLAVEQCLAWGFFFDATGGKAWTACSDTKFDPCKCQGWDNDKAAVPVCNPGATTISNIILAKNNMIGTLPPSIGAFENMTEFYVAYSPKLAGSIPASVSGWKAMTNIQITGNALTGSIPAAFADMALTVLCLDNNDFRGVLPALGSKRFPSTACRIMWAAAYNPALLHNIFTCPLPPGIENCKKYDGSSWIPMTDADCATPCTGLSANLLLPQCLAWLEFFDATGGSKWTACSGNRRNPCDCGCGCSSDGTQITFLSLGEVGLHGTIPDSIGNMTALTEIVLTGNPLLTGTIPASIGKLKKLANVRLFNNSLGGIVPPLPFAQYTSDCSMHGNKFSCPLPADAALCHDDGPMVCTNCTGASIALEPVQCDAWMDFYDATDGKAWIVCNDTRTDPCSCKGAPGTTGNQVCNSDSTAVVTIALGPNNGRGVLPSSIDAWTSIQTFNVQAQSLIGSIPESISKAWKSISSFQVYGNQFTGLLPALSFQKLATGCYLLDPANGGHNVFSCPLPPGASEKCLKRQEQSKWVAITNSDCTVFNNCTGSSTELHPAQCDAWIDFYDATGGKAWIVCNDTRTDPCACTGYLGKFPVCNPSKTSVQQINLEDGNLAGTLPGTIVAFKDIEIFEVGELHGSIPLAIASAWKSMTYFDVYANFFDPAPLPALNFQSMQSKDGTKNCFLLGEGYKNKFFCPWPPNATAFCVKARGFGDWVPITDDDCTPFNNCTGDSTMLEPVQCDAWIDLFDSTGGTTWMNCGENRRDPCSCQEKPASVNCDASSITELHLSGNGLDGTIPASIGSLGELSKVVLRQNRLRGALPAQLFELDKLEYLDVYNNTISGSIPESIWQLSNLQRLYFAHNVMAGTIPKAVAGLDKLVLLDLQFNALAGEVPALDQLTSLATLHLGNNSLRGAFPNSVCQLRKLVELDLTCNELNGSIPDCVGSLTTLREFALFSNAFFGTIPTGVAQLSKLDYFSLWGNRFSGILPAMSFGSIALCDLSGNPFACPLPAGAKENCRAACIMPTPTPITPRHSSTIGVVAGLLCGALLLGLLFLKQKKKRHGGKKFDGIRLTNTNTSEGYTAPAVVVATPPTPHRGGSSRIRTVPISLAQIKHATDHFAERLKLAEGAFGAVYRGTLNGVAVAVKTLTRKDDPGAKSSEYSGENSFALEAKVLGKYRHKNIVGLLCHCLGPSQPSQYLVYEFMPGGSLMKRLAPGSSVAPLTWEERFLVASDTARALEYLHVDADPPIIHQDVKSDNILLGEYQGQLVAKLADFGAVRIAPALLDSTHYSALDVIGTRPYQPVEYTQQGHVSEKTDTFAFGVVVLELLTGKPPANKQTKEFLALEMDPVLADVEKLLVPVLDPRLRSSKTLIPRALKKRLLALGRIAGRCVEMHVRRRVAVREVLVELDVLAGRKAVVRAGRGEEYDPMTGKLVSTVRAAPAASKN